MPRHADLITRFWSHVQKSDGCWLWTGRTAGKGYGVIGSGKRTLYAHRISYELNVGPIPRGMFVCHHCDTPLCVRPDHLFAGTPQDNSDDAVAKGRMASGDRHGLRRHPDACRPPRGEKSGTAKLNVDDVRYLRMLRETEGLSHRELAQRFSIGQTQVQAILSRKKWAHV